MKINNVEIRDNCKYFKGDIPCRFHKEEGARCSCSHYIKRGKRIAIIKLGAIGDVVRTTPVIRKLRKEYPNCEITWITYSPEIIPKEIDNIYNPNTKDIFIVLADRYDALYNFDKDKDACALANLIKADVKKGFYLLNGKCAPIDKNAQHKYLTGLDDGLNKKNTFSYQEEIFQIAGLGYSKERYVLDKPGRMASLPKMDKPIIGLNTGCGPRWQTRLWPEKNWTELAKRLVEGGYGTLILGGEQENKKNKRIAEKSGAHYPGTFVLKDFISLMEQCDLIVTSVTMALHIAIGLGKKAVVLNNIFNRNEFELYGLGSIVEPEVDCVGCFKTSCDKNCMEQINVETVIEEIKKLTSA